MIKEDFFARKEPVKELAVWQGVPVLDMGLTTRCAWASGKNLVKQVIQSRGEVAFGEIWVGESPLVSLDLCLDDPFRLHAPVVEKLAEGELHHFTDLGFSVGLFHALPAARAMPTQLLLATSETGPVASVYRSFLHTVQTAGEIRAFGFGETDFLWGWTSVILPPLSDDIVLTEQRVQVAAKMGSVCGFWLRAGQDKTIQKCLASLSERAEIRLHNLVSSNTFVRGVLRETELRQALNLT